MIQLPELYLRSWLDLLLAESGVQTLPGIEKKIQIIKTTTAITTIAKIQCFDLNLHFYSTETLCITQSYLSQGMSQFFIKSIIHLSVSSDDNSVSFHE